MVEVRSVDIGFSLVSPALPDESLAPKGAAANGQGRKSLESGATKQRSPIGAKVIFYCQDYRPFGAMFCHATFPGLAPCAIANRPVGACMSGGPYTIGSKPRGVRLSTGAGSRRGASRWMTMKD